VAVSADTWLSNYAQDEHLELSQPSNAERSKEVAQNSLLGNSEDIPCFIDCDCHCATHFLSLGPIFVSNATLFKYKMNVADYEMSINTVFHSPSLRPPIA
ncbi:MAG: hypothetical protein HUJ13_10120, partial [Hydrogenovibrio crunogenus]|nr:hypothetical protein [Hydrogenovibrio crunogenus]